MKLNIPNIVEKIELKEYAPELGEQVIYVWVNPTSEMYWFMMNEMSQKTAKNEEIWKWVSEIWSQGAEESRWTLEEVRQLATGLMERDPGLWIWLMEETGRLIRVHRGSKKKNSRPKP